MKRGRIRKAEDGSMMTLDELTAQIATCHRLTLDLARTREVLEQERARLVADLTLTPAECVEALRKHALARIAEGRSVRWYNESSGFQHAWVDTSCENDGTHPAWTIYYSGLNRGERNTSRVNLENEIRDTDSFMFAGNAKLT